ncbi:MAG: sulfatase-like hydrolase/transferase [Nevskiaceae bacterium]
MSAARARGKAIAVTAALAALVFIVLPGSQYMGNFAEFLTVPGAILRLLLAPAVLLILLAVIALRTSGRQDFSRYCSVVAALTLLAWAQSYLLVWDYGVLDGSPIDWGTPWWRGWVDSAVWVAGLGVAVAFHRRLAKPLATGAFVVVALQAGLLATDLVIHRDTLALKAGKRVAATQLDAMARFSPERNALHIVLDSFQADVFNEIVNGTGGDEFKAALSGFTFFEEHLGTFPATYLAMPVILSGQIYRNHVPKPGFMADAYSRGSVLTAARNAGFEVDVAGDSWLLDVAMQGKVDNAYLAAQLPLAQEAARVLDLGLFRLAPHWLKPLVYNDQHWLSQRLFSRSVLLRFAYFTHNAFLASITRRLAADRPAPVYKFFHVMTPHAPFVVNADCSPSGRVVERNRANVTAQSRCSLAFVVALLQRMKQAGIYDNSLIVLMGDHGGHIPPYRYRTGSIVDGDMVYELRPDFVALATPLLAIKPPGATGPLRTSTALTSMTDVAATIDALLGLGGKLPGRSLWDQAYPAAGERRFYGYEWSRRDPVSEYVGKVSEYRVVGSAYRSDSWHIGPEFLPPRND